MKPYGINEWIERYEGDPLRQDAFEGAARIHKLLNAITPMGNDSIVPKVSVIREFIGGLVLKEN